MAYTVYNGERCTRNAFDNGRCALTDGHHGLHTTAAGGLFSTQGGRYLSGDPLLATRSVVRQKVTGPRAGQKVTADNVSESVAAVLADRISAVAQRVESETPLREALASRLDQLTNKLNQEQHNRHRLADQVTALMNRVTALEDRVAKLELPYGHIQAVKDTHNALVERIERLEKDLRDTHDLAERVATAHLERKPEQWSADSAEPPRDGLYVDAEGYQWKFSHDNEEWAYRRTAKYDWSLCDTWASLVYRWRRRNTENASSPAAFPWKVWTNG